MTHSSRMKTGVQFYRGVLILACIGFVNVSLVQATAANPSTIESLIGRYYEANEWCRGSFIGDPRMARGCDLRQEIGDQLSQLGYCLGSFESTGYQAGWMPCVKQERYNPDEIIGRENGWEFIWNERNQRCFVRRTYDEAIHVAIGGNSVNDGPFFWFGEIGTSNSVFSQHWDKPREIYLIFDGQRQWQADLPNRERGENAGFEVEDAPDQFLTDIARSNNLRIYIPDANYERIISLRGSVRALNRIGDCEDEVSRNTQAAVEPDIEEDILTSQIRDAIFAHTRKECSQKIHELDESLVAEGIYPGGSIPLRAHVGPNGRGVYWENGNAYAISQFRQTSDETFEFAVGRVAYEIHLAGVLTHIKQVDESNEYNFVLLNCKRLEDQAAWNLPNSVRDFDLWNIVNTGIKTGIHRNGLRVSTVIDLSYMYYTIGNIDMSRSLLEYSISFIIKSDIFGTIQPWFSSPIYDNISSDDINLIIDLIWIHYQNGNGDVIASHAAEKSLGISTAVDNYLSSAGWEFVDRIDWASRASNTESRSDALSGKFPHFRRKIFDYASTYVEKNELIIKFYETDRHVFRWTIGQRYLSWEKLEISPEELNSLVKTVASSLNFETTAEFDRKASSELFNILFGDMREEIEGAEQLTLVVSGSLTLLPASVLVVPDSSGRVTSSALFLIEETALVYVPSIRELVFERGINDDRLEHELRNLVGFGNPVFDWTGERFNIPDDYPIVWRGEIINYDDLTKVLVPLPGTEQELRQVGRLFDNARVYLGADATESQFRRVFEESRQNEYNRIDVAYFATHGLVAGEMSRFTDIGAEPSLVLSLPDVYSWDDDGILSLTEISRMDIDVKLVVLSACNTASSNGYSPDGLSGLVRDFMVAGARSVLATHWHIADDTTAELMTRFFRIVREEEGVSLAEGLRRAMIQQLDAAEDEFRAHPRFWASFVLVSRGG